MKNINQTKSTKSINRFDEELKNLLAADLKAFKAKRQFIQSTVLVDTAA